MTSGIAIGALAGFIAGKLHERWSRTRWIHSLPARDPHDLLTEDF